MTKNLFKLFHMRSIKAISKRCKAACEVLKLKPQVEFREQDWVKEGLDTWELHATFFFKLSISQVSMCRDDMSVLKMTEINLL